MFSKNNEKLLRGPGMGTHTILLTLRSKKPQTVPEETMINYLIGTNNFSYLSLYLK